MKANNLDLIFAIVLITLIASFFYPIILPELFKVLNDEKSSFLLTLIFPIFLAGLLLFLIWLSRLYIPVNKDKKEHIDTNDV
jgi:Na+/proline symporter